MSGGAVRIRSEPEDFRVDEIPLYEPSGQGDHTFVHVEKRLRTTEEVARALARLVDARARDIGYAGRKDRVAVTRQWFSVPGLDPALAPQLDLPGTQVLAARCHGHKLRTGQLRGNRFDLIVREVDDDVRERATGRGREIATAGMPNRFGGQRFGRQGDNAERGLEILRGKARLRGRDRRDARFLVSAFQSAVFNRVLEERTLGLDEIEPGEVAVVMASGGLFLVEDAARESARARSGEISATGPILGTRMNRAEGAPGEREAAIFADFGVPDLDRFEAPPGMRLRGGRRAVRVLPVGLRIEAAEGLARAVRLRFELPAGSYATVLLEELFGSLREEALPAVS